LFAQFLKLPAKDGQNLRFLQIAVQFDNNSFSVYFGSLGELNGSNAIPVNKCEKGIIGEIWEHKKRHYFDWDFYTNLINSI
jgi:hypothetical protein